MIDRLFNIRGASLAAVIACIIASPAMAWDKALPFANGSDQLPIDISSVAPNGVSGWTLTALDAAHGGPTFPVQCNVYAVSNPTWGVTAPSITINIPLSAPGNPENSYQNPNAIGFPTGAPKTVLCRGVQFTNGVFTAYPINASTVQGTFFGR